MIAATEHELKRAMVLKHTVETTTLSAGAEEGQIKLPGARLYQELKPAGEALIREVEEIESSLRASRLQFEFLTSTFKEELIKRHDILNKSYQVLVTRHDSVLEGQLKKVEREINATLTDAHELNVKIGEKQAEIDCKQREIDELQSQYSSLPPQIEVYERETSVVDQDVQRCNVTDIRHLHFELRNTFWRENHKLLNLEETFRNLTQKLKDFEDERDLWRAYIEALSRHQHKAKTIEDVIKDFEQERDEAAQAMEDARTPGKLFPPSAYIEDGSRPTLGTTQQEHEAKVELLARHKLFQGAQEKFQRVSFFLATFQAIIKIEHESIKTLFDKFFGVLIARANEKLAELEENIRNTQNLLGRLEKSKLEQEKKVQLAKEVYFGSDWLPNIFTGQHQGTCLAIAESHVPPFDVDDAEKWVPLIEFARGNVTLHWTKYQAFARIVNESESIGGVTLDGAEGILGKLDATVADDMRRDKLSAQAKVREEAELLHGTSPKPEDLELTLEECRARRDIEYQRYLRALRRLALLEECHAISRSFGQCVGDNVAKRNELVGKREVLKTEQVQIPNNIDELLAQKAALIAEIQRLEAERDALYELVRQKEDEARELVDRLNDEATLLQSTLNGIGEQNSTLSDWCSDGQTRYRELSGLRSRLLLQWQEVHRLHVEFLNIFRKVAKEIDAISTPCFQELEIPTFETHQSAQQYASRTAASQRSP